MTEFHQQALWPDDELAALAVEVAAEIADARAAPPTPRDLATQLREFNGWTIDKLEILRLYLAGGYARVAGGGTYIDAFAGQGQIGYKGTRRDGSSLIAARSGAFRDLHLFELDPDLHARLVEQLDQLDDRLRRRCHPHKPSDANVAIPALLDAGNVPRDHPCFAFLDPDSTELAWSTVQRLAGYKQFRPNPDNARAPIECKVELWILFNSHQAIYRLWPADRERYPETMSAPTFDRIFGHRTAWWDLWDSGQPAEALLDRYVERLRELGYTYVLPQPIRDPRTRRVQYHMIHATDHPSALGLMRWAKRQTGRVYATELPGMGG